MEEAHSHHSRPQAGPRWGCHCSPGPFGPCPCLGREGGEPHPPYLFPLLTPDGGETVFPGEFAEKAAPDLVPGRRAQKGGGIIPSARWSPLLPALWVPRHCSLPRLRRQCHPDVVPAQTQCPSPGEPPDVCGVNWYDPSEPKPANPSRTTGGSGLLTPAQADMVTQAQPITQPEIPNIVICDCQIWPHWRWRWSENPGRDLGVRLGSLAAAPVALVPRPACYIWWRWD